MENINKIREMINKIKNFNKLINIDGYQLPINIIPISEWVEGKDDPTEYSPDNKVVRVRSDYDYKSDPQGYMRHELIHYLLNTSGVVDDNKPYPQNNIEKLAYTYQFNFLKNKGYNNFDDVLKLIGKENHKEILSQYWNN